MKNDEREDKQAADHHVARRPARFHVISLAVMVGTRSTILDREQDREINVQEHADQQERANHPEQRAEIAQMLRVSVDPFRAEKNLQVPEQMTNHEQDQNYA